MHVLHPCVLLKKKLWEMNKTMCKNTRSIKKTRPDNIELQSHWYWTLLDNYDWK